MSNEDSLIPVPESWGVTPSYADNDTYENGFLNARGRRKYQGPPPKPINPSPGDLTSDVSTSKLLGWESGGQGVAYYLLYFGLSPSFTHVDNKGTRMTPIYNPGELITNTTYYWRVDAVNGGGVTTGDLWSFNTGVPPPPGMVTTPLPVDLDVNVATNTSLSWTEASNTASYNIYFGSTPSLTAGDLIGNQTNSSFTPPNILNYNTTYYWRVDAVNGDGVTTGNVWSFTTAPPAPAMATGPLPADASGQVPETSTLSWNDVPGADSYNVYLGTNAVILPSDFQVNQTGSIFTPTALVGGTTYYWRVDAVNGGGQTVGSVWSFTTLLFVQRTITFDGVPPVATTGELPLDFVYEDFDFQPGGFPNTRSFYVNDGAVAMPPGMVQLQTASGRARIGYTRANRGVMMHSSGIPFTVTGLHIAVGNYDNLTITLGGFKSSVNSGSSPFITHQVLLNASTPQDLALAGFEDVDRLEWLETPETVKTGTPGMVGGEVFVGMAYINVEWIV